MVEIPLKYGCNPNQPQARVLFDGPTCPLQVVSSGPPSYINILDGLRGWQLVRDLKAATGKAAAASYKHVSPAGCAVAGELEADFCRAYFYPLPSELAYSPVATAYARARSSDRVASFGDFIAVSEVVDVSLAELIRPEVSDGIIAPGYEPEALKILQAKKGGRYVMLQIDPTYQPPATERRTDFGLVVEQSYNDIAITEATFASRVTAKTELSAEALETLIVATITLKHTQSNSIAVGFRGQAIGIGAGQQSRIACTRIACDKADRWLLKRHPKALALQFAEGLAKSEKVNATDQFVRYHELNAGEREELATQLVGRPEPISAEERAAWLGQLQQQGGVVLSSDAFIPFRDNLDRAAASGVSIVAQAGGSARDDSVIAAANEHGMVMALTGVRLFLH